MKYLDALSVADDLRRRLVDFSLDELFVRNPKLRSICEHLWKGDPADGGLVADLWVEGAFPARQSLETLDSLVASGSLSVWLRNQLSRTGEFPRDRRLFEHQLDAVRRAADTPGGVSGLVVTAPTGAGKTEAFLLPVLSRLAEKRREGEGIRCLMLYPMNALVNDQVDRLHRWLAGQSRLTLFHFTSETPEDRRAAERMGLALDEPWRFRTRQQARGEEPSSGPASAPPDILVTNYSMLEYMLCRPQDAVFFGPALQAVVVDEAHLYTGTLAAEIALLLRRVFTRCGVDPRRLLTIATSATLGSGDSDELEEFAAQLFSKPRSLVRHIAGQAQEPHFPDPAAPEVPPPAAALAEPVVQDVATLEPGGDGRAVLRRDAADCDVLGRALAPLVSPEGLERARATAEDCPAQFLHAALAQAPVAQRVGHILWEMRYLRFKDLAAQLWGDDRGVSQAATVRLLQWCASARLEAETHPLVPHRLHLVVRAPQGIGVCLNPTCDGPAEMRYPTLGAVLATEADRCPHCRAVVLTLVRCDACGREAVAGRRDAGIALRRAVSSFSGDELPYVEMYVTEPPPTREAIVVDPKSGEISGHGASGVRLYSVERCECGADPRRMRNFAIGAPISLSLVAETVLATLPPYPDESRRWLPAGGRRLLAFSDSRREAAALGPRLTRQHAHQVFRTAFVRSMRQGVVDPALLDYHRCQIQDINAKLTGPGLPSSVRGLLERQMADHESAVRTAEAGGDLDSWTASLREESLLSQLLHEDSAERHDSEHWKQLAWEDNLKKVRDQAPSLIAREFARRPSSSRVSLETAGLMAVAYPGIEEIPVPDDFLGRLPTAAVRSNLVQHWTAFLEGLCDTLRMDGVVTLGSDADDQDYHFEIPIGRWCSLGEVGSRLVRFRGETPEQRRRAFARGVLRASGAEEDVPGSLECALLEAAFQVLVSAASSPPKGTGLAWLATDHRQVGASGAVEAIRIRFPGLALQPLGASRPAYRCEQTGTIWPRSVAGCAPESGCHGTLWEITQETLDRDPRMGRRRREWQETDTGNGVFGIGLWAEEHSAQLSPGENRRLQDLFKIGARNVLSATTTLELGIDIGGLQAALLTNVPPGKANYLQRAGRAGRRAEGSALVVTFARPRPFDAEVFQSLGDYLDRPLRRPLIFLDRERLVRRHLHSLLLGEFFRRVYNGGAKKGAMTAFGRMGAFCGVHSAQWWQSSATPRPPTTRASVQRPEDCPWWDLTTAETSHHLQFPHFLRWLRNDVPADLRDSVEQLVRNTPLQGVRDDWGVLLDGVEASFRACVEPWISTYEELLKGWEVTSDSRQANAIHYQLKALYGTTVIEALGDSQFLPRYGFPIGVMKLRVITPDKEQTRVREEDQFRLARPGLLALADYVPGSQLLVGGKLVTSRGLLKHWVGDQPKAELGLRGQWQYCTNKHFFYSIARNLHHCPFCGEQPQASPRRMLFPANGFTSAAWDPPRRSSDIEIVGRAETQTTIVNTSPSDGRDSFAGIAGARAHYWEGGELLVYNDGSEERGFAVCLRCGYSESERKLGSGRIDLPPGFEHHSPIHDPRGISRCWKDTEAPVLRNETLAAREVTDLLQLDLTGAGLGADCGRLATMTTLAYALRQAGAKLLELDARELGAMTIPAGDQGTAWAPVVYDATPGGSGHVYHLMQLGRDWVEAAASLLRGTPEHDQRCEECCCECILSFSSQFAAQAGLLQRRQALAFLDDLLRDEANTAMISPGPGPAPRTEEAPACETLTVEERQRRAQQRMQARNAARR